MGNKFVVVIYGQGMSGIQVVVIIDITFRIQRNATHLPKLGKEYRLEFKKEGLLSSKSKG